MLGLRKGSTCAWALSLVVLLGACSGTGGAADGGQAVDAGADAGARDAGLTDAGEVCGPGSCSGCCVDDVCMPGTSATYCGASGAACGLCAGMEQCKSLGVGMGGACAVPPGPEWGVACESHDDCSSIGSGALCAKQTTLGSHVLTYEGGYCTRACSGSSDICGGDATCVSLPASSGPKRICAKTCTLGSTDECRTPGYACQDIGGPVGICFIHPLPTFEHEEPPASFLGEPCANDAQCQFDGGFPWGFCRRATNDEGSATGWPEGYCSADCSEQRQICGLTGVCLRASGETEDSCFDRCQNGGGGQSTCRTGYVCEQFTEELPDGGTQPSVSGHCIPDCRSAGFVCESGTACDTATGYCR